MFASAVMSKLSALPMAEHISIVQDASTKGVVVIRGMTGSGKTMMVPPALADVYPDEKIIVLEPRRSVATNAAESVCEIGGYTLGNEIGYRVGRRGRELTKHSPNNRAIYMTYGYALSTDAIHTNRIFVIDEIHENTMDMSIAKALLHRRLRQGDDICVVVMSATIDAEKESAYWGAWNPTIIESEGQSHPCTVHHAPAWSPMEATMHLLENTSTTGILVFVAGGDEIEKVNQSLLSNLEYANITDVDVCTISGVSDYDERKAALKAPLPGRRKVLIGTNVLESGMNLPWVNGGVSTGQGKENEVTRSGATTLVLHDLPQYRLEQQKGRVSRFGPGIFYLVGQTPWNERPIENQPEILRLPVTALVMHCARLEINPYELVFSPALPDGAIRHATKQLLNWGFVTPEHTLTEDGELISGLPVGLEACALLAHANKLGVLAEAIPVAAIVDLEHARKNYREHHFSHLNDSDTMDSLCAYVCARAIPRDDKDRDDRLAELNVGKKKMYDIGEVIRAIEDVIDIDARYEWAGSLYGGSDAEIYKKLKQCLLAANINKLYEVDYPTLGDCHNIVHSSITRRCFRGDVASATIVSIGKNKWVQQTLATNITMYYVDELEEFVKVHRGMRKVVRGECTEYIVGYEVVCRVYAPPPPVGEDKPLSLGNILAEALQKKSEEEQTSSEEVILLKNDKPINVPKEPKPKVEEEPVDMAAKLQALKQMFN